MANQREYRGVYGVEHLCGVWTDIVEIELESVECRSTGCRELLAAKFRCERHFESIFERVKLLEKLEHRGMNE